MSGAASPTPPVPARRGEPGPFTFLARWVRGHPEVLYLLVAAAVYTVLLGYVLVLRYWAFQTYAWDLGDYNQGMYTALFDHRLFYYTADLPSYNPGSLLAAHFSPILFVLIPFYAIAPGPAGLLVIQTTALALSALPLYLFSLRVGVPRGWSLLLACAYLLSPVLMGIGWYDVHPEAFLPLMVIIAVYCYYFARWWTMVIAWIAALAVIETAALLLLAVAAAGLLALIYHQVRGVRSTRGEWVKSLLGTALPIAWIGLVVLTNDIVLHVTVSTLSTTYSGSYSILGPNLGFLNVIPYALVHPGSAGAAISFQWSAKLAYALVLFGSLAFLPLLGPKRLLLPVAVWLALVILSNGSAWYEFGDQFAAYPLPFLAAGAPFGLQRLRSAWLHRKTVSGPVPPERPRFLGRVPLRRRHLPFAVVAAIAGGVLVSSALVSPLVPGPRWMDPYIHHGIPEITSHDEVVHDVLGMIPPTAGVLTVSAIFPELSNRVNAYVMPLSSSFRPNLTFVAALDGYINESQYVLIDFSVDFFGSSILIEFGDLSGFGIVAEDDFVVLFERGWSGPPALWVPLDLVWAGGSLFPTADSFVDRTNGSQYGPSMSSVPHSNPGSLLWYGPFLYGLPAGNYSVSYWLRVTSESAGPQMNVTVDRSALSIQLSLQGPLTVQHDYAFDFSAGPKVSVAGSVVATQSPSSATLTLNVTLNVTWPWLAVWGVSGWIANSSADVQLYAVTLQQLSP